MDGTWNIRCEILKTNEQNEAAKDKKKGKM